MKRSRFSEEQIIGILKEHQAGLSAQDLCRKHGISDATFYKWRSKYGGMDISDARRLKALEEENRKLKKLLAEIHARCGHTQTESLTASNNGVSTPRARENGPVNRAIREQTLVARRACGLDGLANRRPTAMSRSGLTILDSGSG